MRKLFSLMLIAVGLLISGQVKADVVTATTYAELKSQIEGATGERTINVKTDLTGDQTITIENGQIITLNLIDDATITLNAETNFLVLLHGTLNLTGEGTITSTCSTAGWKQMIKIIGSTDPSAVDYSVLNVGEGISLTCNTTAINVTFCPGTKCSYGVKVNVAGYVYGAGNAISVNGTIQVTTGNVPEFYISGTLACSEENVYIDSWKDDLNPQAIYAAGYAKWNITGTVMGACPIYVKGGAVTLDGATVTATGEYKAPTVQNNGADGCGSAIVYDSNAAYSDHMSITIIGETKVSSEAGYAIEECVTSGADKMTAQDFVIVSGTFTGGTQGCITMTGILSEDVKKDGTVSGGTYTGVTNTEEEIKQFLAVAPDGNKIITPVEVGGTVVYVVADKPKDKDWVSTIAAAGATDYVKITANEEVASDKAIAYLNIPGANKVTVKTGAKLSVGEIVLCADAIIEVEAGGKLIVNGTNGLIAFETTNLVIKADAENGMGTFILNPAVKANKSPWATVEYMTGEYCGSETLFGKTKYHWEVLASPFAEILKITSDAAYFSHVVNGNFETCSRTDIVNDTEAFGVFAICSNTTQGNPTKFVFEGKLQGANSLENYSVNKKFNYMGNAYMGKMNAKEMVQELQQSASAVHTLVYLWNVQYMKWDSYTGYQLDELGNVNPMAAIVLYSDKEGSINLDYEKLIWNTNK